MDNGMVASDEVVSTPTLAVAGEPGNYYIAENGTRVSEQSFTERSTAEHALAHGNYSRQDA